MGAHFLTSSSLVRLNSLRIFVARLGPRVAAFSPSVRPGSASWPASTQAVLSEVLQVWVSDSGLVHPTRHQQPNPSLGSCRTREVLIHTPSATCKGIERRLLLKAEVFRTSGQLTVILL